MMSEWFSLLSSAVWRQLDDLGDMRRSGPEARKLVAAWQALLRMHDTDSCGACGRCRRGRAGACTVWQVAIGYLARRPPEG